MRLFSPVPLRSAKTITLNNEQSRYLTRALRLRVGDTLSLFDGSGGEYVATIVKIGKNGVDVDIGDFLDRCLESPLSIRLVQGISRGDRFDTVVQKATELGVQQISPVICDRSVTKLDSTRAIKRRQHWQSIAQSACEQCGRNRVTIIDDVLTLNQWHDKNSHRDEDAASRIDSREVRREHQSSRLILCPTAPTSIFNIPHPGSDITLLIGPEGGFSHLEYEHAATMGFTATSMGPRILRTETAALATIAAVQAFWGDFRA